KSIVPSYSSHLVSHYELNSLGQVNSVNSAGAQQPRARRALSWPSILPHATTRSAIGKTPAMGTSRQAKAHCLGPDSARSPLHARHCTLDTARSTLLSGIRADHCHAL